MKRCCLLLLLITFLLGIACAELQENPEGIVMQEDLVLDDFSMMIDSKWVSKKDEENDAVLFSATSVNHEIVLMVFFSGEGDETKAIETAAFNEYVSGIKREETEMINGINMIFAINADANSVCVYFSAKNHLYTISLTCRSKKDIVDQLRDQLHQMMKTVTLNLD